jgi:paraquat-inducible protein B
MNPAAEPAPPGLPAAAAAPAPGPALNRPRGRQRRAVLFVGLAFLALGLGAAAVWTYYRSSRIQLEATIRFHDAYGLRNGADVRHRGVIVGRVIEVRIQPDSRGVEVRVKLQPEAEHLARAGSHFYIVRPTVSLNNGIRGLDAAIGDVYVEAMRPPALAGEPQTEFEGSEDIPLADAVAGSRQYVLLARRRSYGLRPGAQVTCAGFEIGQVRSVKLEEDGRSVTAVLSIDPKYVRLLDVNSRFVESKPLVAEGSPLNLKLSVDLAALTGGVEMIPPEKPEKEAPAGHLFRLAN